ncbi:MAG: prolipoprotein diacylglyceryl transferase [Bacilli bacterium]|nr:prolipoprotein diacylglyceryl transferase [Bacilli bacterium]
MNRVAFDLGFIEIYWYSITMLLGVVLGSLLAYLEIKRLKLDKEYYFNMLFYAIIFGFIGARFYYVLFNLDYYLNNLGEIIAVWNGGLAIHGGIIGGVLTIIVYSLINQRKINEILKYMDISAVGVMIGQIIGRWGNFFNQEAHGGISSIKFLKSLYIPDFIIKGMTINNIVYHPTFLYESLLNLIGLIILLIVRHNKKIKNGMILSLYLIWYSIVRFFIESMRTDSLMIGNLKMAQVISIILIVCGIILFIYSWKKNDYYNQVVRK